MLLNLRYSHGRNRVKHRSPEFNIDVPSEYWEISNYRATLGHKANHSFLKSNAKYVSVIHPRHGPISAVISKRKIKKGEATPTVRQKNPDCTRLRRGEAAGIPRGDELARY